MSRLTGSDVKSMMEAYNAVYAPQELTEEQVWVEVENWVNSLLEEGYDLSDCTWEEMYESYIEENTNDGIGYANTPSAAAQLRQRSKNIDARGGWGGQAYRAINRAFGAKEPSWDKADRDDRRREQTALKRAKDPNWKPTTKPTEQGGDGGGDGKIPPKLPAAPEPAAPKPAPTGLTGAKALATAAAEKARIRGTSETDNPLMKNMRSRMAAPTSAQSPDVAKLGKGNQSLVNNPNVAKPTPSPDARAIAAKASVANVTAPSPSTPAAAPKPPTRQLSAADKRQGIKASYEYDAYDLVLEYLLAEGHADTVEEANYVMMEMDAEMVQSIVEAKVDERLPEHERSGARLKRYDNPSGALALGGGQQRTRREEHKERRGKKTKG
jgi:hypothetical protein